MHETFIAWLISMMVAYAPPSIADAPVHTPEYLELWRESPEQRRTRYDEIARAAFAVAHDPAERPLFGGPSARTRTAHTLLAIAMHESGFSPDVDRGPCWRGRDGKSKRCDGGRANCMMQVHVGYGGKTREGWTAGELFADRKKCFAAGLHILQASQNQCRRAFSNGDVVAPIGSREAFRWAGYAGGGCTSKAAQAGSAELVRYTDRWWGMAQPKSPGPDSLLVRAPGTHPSQESRSAP
jgi:hypothetical protein